MPPRTRSIKMVGTSAEGEETSMNLPSSEGDFVSIMAKMMEDLKQDLKSELKQETREEVRCSEVRNLAVQNTLLEEINALKDERNSRPPTPRGNVVPNAVPEEMVEEEVYAGWQGRNDRNRFNYMENGRFGGEDGARGRFGVGNQHRRMEPYGDRFRRDRYHGDELRPRFDDPSKTLKHILPKFHRKFDPEAYLEWESQVDKVFSLHNYSEGDKVKIALAEFRGLANTWWNDVVRKRRLARMGEVLSWGSCVES